jgi:hypothetical protein
VAFPNGRLWSAVTLARTRSVCTDFCNYAGPPNPSGAPDRVGPCDIGIGVNGCDILCLSNSDGSPLPYLCTVPGESGDCTDNDGACRAATSCSDFGTCVGANSCDHDCCNVLPEEPPKLPGLDGDGHYILMLALLLSAMASLWLTRNRTA